MKPLDIKLASEERLAALGVTVNEHLPIIEAPAELAPRSALQVSTRACVLSHVIGVGHGRSGSEMREWLVEAGLAGALTPREKDFLKQKRYSEQDRAWAAWQFAAVHACAWALGLEAMDPLGECPDTLASHFPPRTAPRPGGSLRRAKHMRSCRVGGAYREKNEPANPLLIRLLRANAVVVNTRLLVKCRMMARRGGSSMRERW